MYLLRIQFDRARYTERKELALILCINLIFNWVNQHFFAYEDTHFLQQDEGSQEKRIFLTLVTSTNFLRNKEIQKVPATRYLLSILIFKQEIRQDFLQSIIWKEINDKTPSVQASSRIGTISQHPPFPASTGQGRPWLRLSSVMAHLFLDHDL